MRNVLLLYVIARIDVPWMHHRLALDSCISDHPLPAYRKHFPHLFLPSKSPPSHAGVDNTTADFKKKSPCGRVPVLETPQVRKWTDEKETPSKYPVDAFF